jgi:hypothetical protein
MQIPDWVISQLPDDLVIEHAARGGVAKHLVSCPEADLLALPLTPDAFATVMTARGSFAESQARRLTAARARHLAGAAKGRATQQVKIERRLELVKAMLAENLTKRDMAKWLGCSVRSVYKDIERLHRERSAPVCPYCQSRYTNKEESAS